MKNNSFLFGGRNERGQLLIAAIGLMLTLSLFIPVLVQMVQQESRTSVRKQQSTQAFNLAESALDRGYQELILSTTNWATVTAGTPVPGFNFDTTYTSPEGGEYRIRFSSGVGGHWITAVARDKSRKEVAGIRGQFIGNGLLNASIYAGGQVGVSGSAVIEWGKVMARNDINTAGALWPRFYSTGKVDPVDVDPTVPNTDNRQYWAYYTNMPIFPSIDLNYYKNRAQTMGVAPADCGSSYYKVGNIDFQGCNGGGAGQAGTWYITGNAKMKAGAGGNYLVGEIIALGNFEMDGNGGSFKSLSVPIPPDAWREYGEATGTAWAHYQAMDPSAPATYAAAEAADYVATGNYTINDLLINGLMYQGGNYQATGSGNASFYGVVFSAAQPTLGANMTLYFKHNITFQTTSFALQRVGWRPVVCDWPTFGAPVCP